jgi:hypothetical protein
MTVNNTPFLSPDFASFLRPLGAFFQLASSEGRGLEISKKIKGKWKMCSPLSHQEL